MPVLDHNIKSSAASTQLPSLHQVVLNSSFLLNSNSQRNSYRRKRSLRCCFSIGFFSLQITHFLRHRFTVRGSQRDFLLYICRRNTWFSLKFLLSFAVTNYWSGIHEWFNTTADYNHKKYLGSLIFVKMYNSYPKYYFCSGPL